MGNLLSRVTSTAQSLPSRVFLYAREKWGKSSTFAHAPGAIFFMTRGETGLVELIAGGRVPPTAHFHYDEADPPTWGTLRQAVRELIEEDHPHKALVIDTCNGAEILCQEYVRNSQFNGSQAKFGSYGKGWDSCRVEWLGLLRDLDHLRSARKMSVVFLAHTQVKKFDDPTAEDSYDKYRPACQEKLWDLTHKWADIICFGHFEAQTFETESGKVKAKAEVKRVLCFDQSPTWEAGNRYGISGKLDVGGGAKNAFKRFAEAVAKAKAASQQAAKPAAPAAPAEKVEPPAVAPEGEQRADPTPAASAPSAAPRTASATTPPTPTPAPEPATKSAPVPKHGADLPAWLDNVEAGLVERDLCSEGALKARVIEAASARGAPADVDSWGADAVELAVATAREFERLVSRPESAAARAELARTRKKWSLCCTWLNARFNRRYDGRTKLWDVPAEELAALAADLKTHTAPAQRETAGAA